MSDFERSAIDASLARRLIDRQCPQWSELPISEVELDGWDNRTFRLGSELSVPLPTGDWPSSVSIRARGRAAAAGRCGRR